MDTIDATISLFFSVQVLEDYSTIWRPDSVSIGSRFVVVHTRSPFRRPRNGIHGRRFFWLLPDLWAPFAASRSSDQPDQLETIRDGVLRFTAGDLDHHISVKRADELGELTEPFYRADASRRRKTGGFGLVPRRLNNYHHATV